MTGQEMYEHVRDLAEDMGVLVLVCMNCRDAWGMARNGDESFEKPLVFLGQPPDAVAAYLTALHELGHHADPRITKRLSLDREAWAWRWAIEQARVEPDWGDILDALDSYRRDRRFKRTEAFEALYAEVKENA